VAAVEKLRKRVSEYDWEEAERLGGGDADEDWQKLKASRDAWAAVKRVQERVGDTLQGAGVTIQGAGVTIQETVGGKIQDVQQALQGVVTGWVAADGASAGNGGASAGAGAGASASAGDSASNGGAGAGVGTGM